MRIDYLARVRRKTRRTIRGIRNRFRPVRVDGHRMFVDPGDTLRLARHGVYEPFATELMKGCITEGDAVIDLGANIGYYTLLAARCTGDKGRVFGFEPDPRNFALLEKNVALNRRQNVILEQKAVANRNGSRPLYLARTNQGDRRLHASGNARRSVTIDAVALDVYFGASPPRIRLIKMDIQGAEGLAIQGMRRLLAGNTPLTLVTEFWPAGLVASGSDPREYLAVLEAEGFRLERINERDKRLDLVSADELMEAFGDQDPNALAGVDITEAKYVTNLFCTKR